MSLLLISWTLNKTINSILHILPCLNKLQNHHRQHKNIITLHLYVVFNVGINYRRVVQKVLE